MARRILVSNRGRFGPFASGRGYEKGLVLFLYRLRRQCAQQLDAFGELAAQSQFKLIFYKNKSKHSSNKYSSNKYSSNKHTSNKY
jgi:hypothetical protein